MYAVEAAIGVGVKPGMVRKTGKKSGKPKNNPELRINPENSHLC
jgi:hypothetical protein